MIARIYLASLAILVALSPLQGSAAATESIAYSFKGVVDGIKPVGGLIAGTGGTFYGTTTQGGSGICHYSPPYTLSHGCGTVFVLSPPTVRRAAWTKRILYDFVGGADGARPFGALIADKSGALYGTTANGGGSGDCGSSSLGDLYGCGTVFKLTPPATGQTTWTGTVLYKFQGIADGTDPSGDLIIDASGAIYGTTSFGGAGAVQGGTVFRLAPPAPGRSTWTKTTLRSFNALGADGANPTGGLIMDPSGALFGTTSQGGGSANCGTYQGTPNGCGTVFKLTPPAGGRTVWTETVLRRFQANTDGSGPRSNLMADLSGNLYGTTSGGGGSANCGTSSLGGPYGCGTVFRLSHPMAGETRWTETVLYRFQNQTDGNDPQGPLVENQAGVFYGTSLVGGPGAAGTVFKLALPAAGQTIWSFTLLHSFTGGIDGGYPGPTLASDSGGALYGTTFYGGGSTRCGTNTGCGTVFKLVP